jgi:hypothetical protein
MTSRGVAAAGLACLLACGQGESATEPTPGSAKVQASTVTVTRLGPVADGSVRDGNTVIDRSVVQTLHVPSFEDRGVIEFDLQRLTGTVRRATLILPVFNSKGPYPFRIDVYGYRANGVLEVEDWGRGVLIKSFQYAGASEVQLDVTAKLARMRQAGATGAGFVFRFAVPSDIDLNGPYVAFGSMEYRPAARLRVETE